MINISDKWKCHKCDRLRVVCDNIYYVCPNCGECNVEQCYDTSSVSTCKMPKKTVYNRGSYFDTLLSRIQARNFIHIEPELQEKIKKNMKGAKDMRTLKKVLKTMDMSNHYKYAPYILNSLYGKSLFDPLTLNEENQLRMLFHDLQESFEKNKPHGRENFLNYNYVLYQLLHQIGRDDLCCLIPLPQIKHLLKKHEALWNAINNF